MLTVVTGPPCSGKTTYVREHARPGDIRIDFDDLAQALGSPVRHGHSDAIWRVTVDARNAAIRTAISWHRSGARVWIVDTAMPHFRRAQYHKAEARIVTLTATREELHRRADAERPPEWHERIDRWLTGQPAPAATMRPR